MLLKIKLLFLSIFILSTGAITSFASEDCFINHISEARRMNIERKPIYAQMSDGRSLSISDQMINSETLLIAAAWSFEQLARPLRAQGIEIFCNNLVPMSETPAVTGLKDIVMLDEFDPAVTEKARKRLAAAFSQQNYQELNATSRKIILELADQPRYHCMLRHLTESIARAATLADGHIAAATRIHRGFLAKKIINNYIRLQIMGLKLADRLDQDAALLAAEGIGIVCDDVPPIPLP